MINDKLKQDHVFVKNNVGSLALHKAKQEIGGKKMGKKEFIKETVDELLELKNNWKKQGALEELKKIRFKLETCCGIEKLYVYTQTRIKELGE